MKKNWSLEKNVYDSNITVSEMVDAIEVFDRLKHKYPNDENIDLAIEILRDEICQMFGGTIYDNM
jgi:hypothetical protein